MGALEKKRLLSQIDNERLFSLNCIFLSIQVQHNLFTVNIQQIYMRFPHIWEGISDFLKTPLEPHLHIWVRRSQMNSGRTSGDTNWSAWPTRSRGSVWCVRRRGGARPGAPTSSPGTSVGCVRSTSVKARGGASCITTRSCTVMAEWRAVPATWWPRHSGFLETATKTRQLINNCTPHLMIMVAEAFGIPGDSNKNSTVDQ